MHWDSALVAAARQGPVDLVSLALKAVAVEPDL
jgi:hypothetical protein